MMARYSGGFGFGVKTALPLAVFATLCMYGINAKASNGTFYISNVTLTAFSSGGNGSTLKVPIEEISSFSFNFSIDVLSQFDSSSSHHWPRTDSQLLKLQIQGSVDKESYVNIVSGKYVHLTPSDHSGNFSIKLEGILPGRAKLFLAIYGYQEDCKSIPDNHSDCENANASFAKYSFPLLLTKTDGPLDIMFIVVISCIVLIATIGLGCEVDLAVVKAELKRPVGPIVGLCSQFVFMPLIGFTVAHCFSFEPGMSLGFFALGCAPGGLASNVYTFLLNANVSLSVTMTLISTLAALGLLPLWYFTVGRLIFTQEHIQIPYGRICMSLFTVIIPVTIGLFLKKKHPRIAWHITNSVKYITAVFLVFVLTAGVYIKIYVFYLLSPKILFAASLLPYLGFISGGIAAWLARQSRANIIAISIETGLQNTMIPIVLLQVSLPSPERDVSILPAIMSSMFTPIPIMFAILYVQLKLHRSRAKREHTAEVEDMNSINETHHSMKMDKVDDDNDNDVDGDGYLAKQWLSLAYTYTPSPNEPL